jgi:hypothetical protein
MHRLLIATVGLGLMLTTGCPKGGPDGPEPPAPDPTTADSEPKPAEPTTLTSAQCQAEGGTIVGDIGDGAIHRPDYLCESGQRPIGSIVAEQGEPIAVEGAVCCPAPAA